MRSLSPALAAHIAEDAHTLCAIVRIDLVDGSTLAFTDHDRTIDFDFGDGVATFRPDTGILPSDLSLSVGFDADDIEISGPIGDVVTRTQVLGGRFDDARVRYAWVNWAGLAPGAAKLLKGWVVQARVEGGRFKLTCHSEMSRFAQSIGVTLTPYCRWDYGSTECGATPVTLAATVTGTPDPLVFTVTFSGTFANDYFNKGTVSFATGELAGIRPVEIFDWTSGGVVTLIAPLPEAPQVGDTLTIKQGCGKTRADCIALQGDAINFGGFPDVPGSDKVLQYANPGGG